MGRTKPCLLIFFLTIIMLVHSTIATNPKGFTLRMIHKDSEESPFYNPLDRLITPDERFRNLIDQSRARARYISSQINPDVSAPVSFEGATSHYAASVGIGTFPNLPDGYMNYYLAIDSGSDLTWLQCKGATQFFHQDSDLYPWQDSQSYNPIPCNNITRECQRCNQYGQCIYRVSYVTSQVTSGVYARENFTFVSRTRGPETVRLQMGCGFSQENFNMGTGRLTNRVAGILGLGRGSRSFITQLGEGGGKFSYCFDKTGNTFLSIGADATIGSRFFSRTTIQEFSRTHYYLNLEGISVNGSRLRIQRNELEFRNGAGGCIIDSGSPFTIMYKNIFNTVRRSVERYFQDAYKMDPAAFDQRRQLCFKAIDGFRFDQYRKPPIIFHFQDGADFVISESFYMYEEKLCLGITKSDSNMPAVLFGAFQQTNKRVLYDRENSGLYFANADCRRG